MSISCFVVHCRGKKSLRFTSESHGVPVLVWDEAKETDVLAKRNFIVENVWFASNYFILAGFKAFLENSETNYLMSVRLSSGFFGQPVTFGAECCSQEPSFFLKARRYQTKIRILLFILFISYCCKAVAGISLRKMVTS